MTTRAPRIPYRESRPALRAMGQLHRAVNDSVLDRTIVELVRVRVSQLNGCAYCIDVHARDAVAAGESHRRLMLLSGWREAGDMFTRQEQAALAAAEGTTLLAQTPLPDAVIDSLDDHFTVDEQVALLYAIAETNAWNRLAVAAHTPLDDDK